MLAVDPLADSDLFDSLINLARESQSVVASSHAADEQLRQTMSLTGGILCSCVRKRSLLSKRIPEGVEVEGRRGQEHAWASDAHFGKGCVAKS
ncbi:hypothetical protein D6D08_07617 [Aureobasidium pullulans]|nr:hypothetical protein D6D08_07617 [Aureobasidium pullulans]